MTPKPHYRDRLARVLIATLLAGLAGCAQMKSLKRSIGHAFGVHPPKVTTEKTPAPAPSTSRPAADTQPVVPLKSIVADQLQRGHYAKGRRQLHRYLKAHPDDRAARDMWRQLTVDPDKQLGSRSRIHVVQAGESYSSMAVRYLGDADRFLVLARYNGAADPSQLKVGQRIRIPLSKTGSGAAPRHESAPASTPVSSSHAAASTSAPAAPQTPQEKAEQLQQQSVVLYQEGKRQQAEGRLDKALKLDPTLKSSGPAADAVRKSLLADYYQRAIVLYRDQKLTRAIQLWDRILAIDPNYEQTRIFRAHAKELQSRLKQL